MILSPPRVGYAHTLTGNVGAIADRSLPVKDVLTRAATALPNVTVLTDYISQALLATLFRQS